MSVCSAGEKITKSISTKFATIISTTQAPANNGQQVVREATGPTLPEGERGRRSSRVRGERGQAEVTYPLFFYFI